MAGTPDAPTVRLDRADDAHRVDVLVDGDRFTTYRYDEETVAKPLLFPVTAPSGAPVTRGYPLDTRPADRRDHPHQVGHWFTHGDVNGVDFWNNSRAVPPGRADEMGAIRHRTIERASAGDDAAELAVRCEWLRPDGSALLEESTRFAFRAGPGTRAVDRTTTLAAVDEPVTFGDTKEALCGLRVARPLELPVEEELVFTDVHGEQTVVTATGDHEVTGAYWSAGGVTDDDAWGSRSEWLALSGDLDGAAVTVSIHDHPSNPDHPTHWMARPYGLFAANPLGRAAFEADSPPLDYTIDEGAETTFRYRLFVQSGRPTPEALAATHDRFVDGT
jgi:hypothetical protein